MRRRLFLTLALLLGGAVALVAQPLSTQVLQLLTRANTWGALQTYANAIKITTFIPGDTTLTLYTDGTDLFWEGGALTGGGSVTTPHNLLSTTHPDTLVAAVSRGSILVGNATPAWAEVTIGGVGAFLRSDGTDAAWGTDGSALTSLTAANLTGALPAIAGANLTSLNASALASGTVPLARLSGITTSEIAGAAGILYSQLDLTGAIDLTTDISATVLPVANGGTNLAAAADDNVMVGNGTTWQSKAVPDCDAATAALNYDTATNAITCRTLSLGTGTVTSVALALPGIFTVSGSPVTTTGTLTGALATQAANLVLAGPTSGGAATPTFRALVNADLPLTGVAANTYSSITVNTAGVITAGSVTQSLAAVTGTLGVANGGTGVTAIGDDNVFLGSAATTAAAASVPNCVAASCWGIGYTQATNLFAAIATRTVAFTEWLDSGLCQNATPVLAWSTPTTQPGVAACVTGTNTQKLVVDFANTTELSIQRERRLPDDWTGALDADIWWYTTATTGSVVWQIQTACVGNTQTGDPSFNTASTATDAAHGTTNQYNLAAITGIDATGCDAGDVLYLRVFRDPAHGSDDLAATARLVGVELTYRRAI